MIQIKCPADASAILILNDFYLDLYDKIRPDTVYRPLMVIQSQLTKYSKTALISVNSANKERYLGLQIRSTRGFGGEHLDLGQIKFGTTNFPLGFYDVTFYKNTSTSNMDIAGLSVIYNGLANVIGNTDATSPVQYSEYTTNDSDTESVYITF